MRKIIFVFLLLLSSCSQFEPFVDARREAGQVQTIGQSTSERVAICYNPLWSNEGKIENLANEICSETKRKPELDDKNYFNCSLFQPFTVFYRCI